MHLLQITSAGREHHCDNHVACVSRHMYAYSPTNYFTSNRVRCAGTSLLWPYEFQRNEIQYITSLCTKYLCYEQSRNTSQNLKSQKHNIRENQWWLYTVSCNAKSYNLEFNVHLCLIQFSVMHSMVWSGSFGPRQIFYPWHKKLSATEQALRYLFSTWATKVQWLSSYTQLHNSIVGAQRGCSDWATTHITCNWLPYSWSTPCWEAAGIGGDQQGQIKKSDQHLSTLR